MRGYPSASCLQRCSLCHVSCPRLRSCHLRHNTSRHDRPRPFHVAYGRSQRSMAASPMRALNNNDRAQSTNSAGSSASPTTLACASLLAKVLQKAVPPPLNWLARLCLRLSAHLPRLAPSCEKATLKQRQQVRKRMTQLAIAVATGHRKGGCHVRLLGRSAQHSERSLLRGVTISLQLLLAVVYGQEYTNISGGPGADATALRGRKTERRRPSHTGQWRVRATNLRSSDRLQWPPLLRWDA